MHTPDGEEVGSVVGLEEGSLLGVAVGLCATVTVGAGETLVRAPPPQAQQAVFAVCSNRL